MKQVEIYRIFEITLPGTAAEGSFQTEAATYEVKGFLSGENQVTVRFMPDALGDWHYLLTSDTETVSGNFLCTPAAEENHGPVQVRGRKFAYADGSRYLPFGTTCYAWAHQTEALREETLNTLKNSPFNKVRMLLFPKSTIYCEYEPACFPFLKNGEGKWDVHQPDQRFWQDFEAQILELDKLGIEADLILFHPYDRWGFASLSREEGLAYLDYCIARLGAYKNIWWSIANEYDLVLGKTEADWDAYGERVFALDQGRHLLSIHNCCQPYPDRGWISHCSIQTNFLRLTLTYSWAYQKPIVIDECSYEGDLEFTWGGMSAFEMVHRTWMAVCCGGYCTHGETYHDDNEILWWGKGGKIRGESAERIAFLKELLESLPGTPEAAMANLQLDGGEGTQNSLAMALGAAMERMPEGLKTLFMAELIPMVCGTGGYSLFYAGRVCQSHMDVWCPGAGAFRAEVIDIWDMTRTPAGEITGGGRIKLPAKEGQAILLTKIREA